MNLSRFVTKTRDIQKQLSASPDISSSQRSEDKPYDIQYVCHTPFFFLGSDGMDYGSSNYCAYLDPASQLKYLDNSIGTSLSFVFCHQPPHKTVKGSYSSNCISNTGDLLKILRKHPKAIMFTAHTHRSFEGSPLTLNNNYSHLGLCPVLSSPSVYRSSEGFHIMVYKNMVCIQGIKYCSDTSYVANEKWEVNISR